MSVTPPTISPRLRSRESIAVTNDGLQTTGPSAPPLRVLIRLPDIAAPATNATRFQFAATLFSTLKRKYAAAAFAIFFVCMVALLLRGKRGTPTHDDSASDAPRWSSSVTVPSTSEQPGGPMLQSAGASSRTASPASWPADKQLPAEPQRQPTPNSTSWQPPIGGPAMADPMHPTSTAQADPIRNMPPHYPSHDTVVERAPPWQSQSVPPGVEVRTAQRDDLTFAPGRGAGRPEQPGVARLTGRLDQPAEQPSADPSAPWNHR